jgi:site-specific DNA recombinase
LTVEVPDLRIVDHPLWDAAKARQQSIRRLILEDGRRVASEKARRPAHLLSGLLCCGVCGGGFSMVSAAHYGCSTARNKGTCSNRLAIRRDVLEASVLDGLKVHLMAPTMVKEFIAEYHAELNRLMAGRDGDSARHSAKSSGKSTR